MTYVYLIKRFGSTKIFNGSTNSLVFFFFLSGCFKTPLSRCTPSLLIVDFWSSFASSLCFELFDAKIVSLKHYQ